MKEKSKKINKQKEIYDNRYLSNYREKLNGYEYARWKALNHFILKVFQSYLNNFYSQPIGLVF